MMGHFIFVGKAEWRSIFTDLCRPIWPVSPILECFKGFCFLRKLTSSIHLVPDVLGAAAPAAAAVGPTRGEEPPAAAAAVPTVEAEAAVLLTEDVTAAANCGRVLGRC